MKIFEMKIEENEIENPELNNLLNMRAQLMILSANIKDRIYDYDKMIMNMMPDINSNQGIKFESGTMKIKQTKSGYSLNVVPDPELNSVAHKLIDDNFGIGKNCGNCHNQIEGKCQLDGKSYNEYQVCYLHK